jgi:hypothetical protein
MAFGKKNKSMDDILSGVRNLGKDKGIGDTVKDYVGTDGQKAWKGAKVAAAGVVIEVASLSLLSFIAVPVFIAGAAYATWYGVKAAKSSDSSSSNIADKYNDKIEEKTRQRYR